MKNQLQDNLAVVEQIEVNNVPTKSTFGAFSAPNPMWATNMFRIAFLLTTVATGYLAATNLLTPESKYEVTLILKLVIDPLMFGISKLWGIVVDDSKS